MCESQTAEADLSVADLEEQGEGEKSLRMSFLTGVDCRVIGQIRGT